MGVGVGVGVLLVMISSMRVTAVVMLSETVEELVGEAVIVVLKTVDVVLKRIDVVLTADVVFCAEGGVVVLFMASGKIEDERDADAVMVAFSSDVVDT